MTTWHNLSPQERIDTIIEMRSNGTTWYDIARAFKCSRHKFDELRPLLPPELNRPLGNRGSVCVGVTVRQRVHDLLDAEDDMESAEIAERLDINFNSACYYRSTWKVRYNEPDPEPPRRCECGLGLWNGETRCSLCEMQAAGLVVVYAMPGWAVAVGDYLTGEG